MDLSASEIVFTDAGCNFCDQARKSLYELTKQRQMAFFKDKDKKYDVLIGLSGGVDSAYTLYRAVKMGLRPLCFSVDNGWNSPVSDENIMKLVEGMKVPFYRHVIDLQKFKELQMAFIKAGVKNIEIPTDHILMAVAYDLADKYDITTILSGGNVATESIMPPSWGYSARDLTHIMDIYKKITGKRLTGLPTCSLLEWNYYKWVRKIKTVYLLDYINYNREEAIKVLTKEFGFKHPGEKHCESIWTWWFQNYYLFEKFGIDKRKAHLSSLIVSGQMTREEALKIVNENPVYPKLGIEEKVMKYKKHEHSDYKQDEKLFNFIGRIVKKLC
jgi:hypothetical protein